MKRIDQIVIAACLAILALLCTAFYLFSYKPNKEEILRTRSRIKAVQTDIATQETTITKAREAIAVMDLDRINLNYFNRHAVSASEKTPFFLKSLNDLANSLGIRFLSISPGNSEQKSGYVKEVFEIQIRTDFERLAQFLWHLSYKLGINVDRLVVESKEDKEGQEIEALMNINSLEMADMADQEVVTLRALRRNHITNEQRMKEIKLQEASTSEEGPPLKIARSYPRDPFTKPARIQEAQERLQQTERELSQSKLLGIIDFGGQRHAIIGNNTVKKGDRLFNLSVLDITHDKVILGSGDIRFTYTLKKDDTR